MFFVHFDDKHVFLIFVPMARGLPQFAIHNLGGVHLDISATFLLAAHVILQGCVNLPSIWMPKDLARRFFLHVEQVHFAPQLAVVTFCGLFQHGQVRL